MAAAFFQAACLGKNGRRIQTAMKSLALLLTLAALPALAQYPHSIVWNNETWIVKRSSAKVGPGPNTFSDSSSNVWVDATNRLHLKITGSGAKWQCAEVIRAISSGHGTYRFYLDTPVDNLDKNVVLGLFTWNDAPDYNHRELDVEFSRWGNASDPTNPQYVVQPYSTAGNLVRFLQPSVAASIHSFAWSLADIVFNGVKGTNPLTTVADDQIAHQTFTADNPVPGGEQARINLWLFHGKAPSDKKSVEVILSKFEYLP